MKLLGFQPMADGRIAIIIEPGPCATVGHLQSSLGAGISLWPSDVAGAEMYSEQARGEVVRMLRGMAEQVEASLRNPGACVITPSSLADQNREPS